MNLEMMGGILEYNEGAHIWSSSDQQNGDVLGEALNNFQTMTYYLIDPETVESSEV